MFHGERLKRVFYVPGSGIDYDFFFSTDHGCYEFLRTVPRVAMPEEAVDYPLPDYCQDQPIVEVRANQSAIVLGLRNGGKVIFDYLPDFSDGNVRGAVDFQDSQEAAEWESEFRAYKTIAFDEKKSE